MGTVSKTNGQYQKMAQIEPRQKMIQIFLLEIYRLFKIMVTVMGKNLFLNGIQNNNNKTKLAMIIYPFCLIMDLPRYPFPHGRIIR